MDHLPTNPRLPESQPTRQGRNLIRMLFRSSGDDDQKIDCEANKHNNQTESIQYQKWPHIETEQQTPASGATSKFAALKRKLFPSQNRRHPRQMSTLISPINAPVKLSLPHLGDNLDTQATTDLSLSEESLTPRHLEFKLPEYIAESDTFPENSDNNSEIAHKTSLLDDDDDRDLERAVEVLDFESSIADKTLQDMSNAIDDLRAWKEAHEQKTQDALDKLYDLQKAEKQLQYDEQPQDGFEYDHLVELTLQQQQQNREMQALELRKEAEAFQLECNLLHAKLRESEATRMEQTLRNSDSEGLALSRLRNDVFQLDVKQRQEALLHELQGADADLDMNIADVQAFTDSNSRFRFLMAARELIALEDVAKMPAPGLCTPSNVSFSPDGRTVAFLHAPVSQSGLSRQLYALDVASRRVYLLAAPPNQGNTEGNLSLEEKLRRERQRQMGVGITSYAWNPPTLSQRLLYPLQGDIYLQEEPGAELKLLFDKSSTNVAGGAIDPQFSPDGRWVAFVQDKELYILSSHVTEGGQQAIQVTQGARGVDGKSNGLACFLTQEELSRFRGFWWSPDSTRLVFEEIDERHIPKFKIMHSGSEEPTGAAAQEDHRYPFAGAANPKRRLGVIKLPPFEYNVHFQKQPQAISTPVWMEFAGGDSDFYITRVNWLPDQSLGVQKVNRLQTEVTFLRFDVHTGRATTLIHETNSVWLNANYLFRNVEAESKSTFRFLWGSERSGFMHLYLYEYTTGAPAAHLLGAVTSGKWCVESVEGVDLAQGYVYFSGTADSPLERHLYVTSLFPASDPPRPPVRLTGEEGMHMIVMDSSCRMFVDVYSNTTTPPRALVCTVPSMAHLAAVKPVQSATLLPVSDPVATVSAELAAIFQTIRDSAFPLTTEQDDMRVSILQAQSKLCVPKIITIPTRDGKELLYGAVYLPDPTIYGPGPYPTMVSVYGGPHVQRVSRMWAMTVDMRAQRFRDMGYVVLKVDNRGSFRRGSAFEGAIKNCMGTIEILDQQDGVRKLVDEGITIEGRVGIYGWSYGGYMAAISLMKAPETFKLAIAGAPVTSWDGYDTCYTERYMSTPQLNPSGYKEGSVMEAVGNMQKRQKLLLIHGLIDENVHFRHTARLITALINARKHYDLLLFPGERHSPRHLEDRIYMEQRIAEYVEANQVTIARARLE